MSDPRDTTQKHTRAEQSRINGAKSRGPKTPEGKAKCSQNSTKHGLGSRSLVLNTESPILFAEYKEHYWKHFRPKNLVEADLVIEMVGARWRLRRIWSHETALLDSEIDKLLPPVPNPDGTKPDILMKQALAFKTLADESKSLEMVHRYESRYRRCYERALRNLQQIRENDPLDPNAPIFDNIPGPPAPKPPEPTPEPPPIILQNEPERKPTPNPLLRLAILSALILHVSALSRVHRRPKSSSQIHHPASAPPGPVAPLSDFSHSHRLAEKQRRFNVSFQRTSTG